MLAQAQAETAAQEAAATNVQVAAAADPAPIAQADTTQVPVAESQRSLREMLKPEWKDRSDEEVADELSNYIGSARQIHEQSQQMQQYYAQKQALLDYAQQHQQHQSEFQKYLASQQQPQTTNQPQKFWDAAPYDASWEAWRDASSPTGWRDGTPTDVVSGWNRYVSNQREFFNKLRTDWDGTVGGWVDQRAQSMVEKAIEDRVSTKLNEFQAKLDAQQFVMQNADWLAQRDPLTGAYGLSPAGAQLHQKMQMLQNLGVQDTGATRALAAQLLMAEIMQSQRGQPGLPAPANGHTNGHDLNQQHKNRILEAGASRQPNRGGTIPHSTDATPQNTKLSLEQLVREELLAQGIN